MTYDLNRTNLRLENTTNKMLSLKNLQFMEARVHDETESSVNTANRNVESVSTDSQVKNTFFLENIIWTIDFYLRLK